MLFKPNEAGKVTGEPVARKGRARGRFVSTAITLLILGGLGSVPGAVVGGLLLGMIESFTATIFGSLVSDILQLLLVILILLVRPSGLLGQREA